MDRSWMNHRGIVAVVLFIDAAACGVLFVVSLGNPPVMWWTVPLGLFLLTVGLVQWRRTRQIDASVPRSER